MAEVNLRTPEELLDLDYNYFVFFRIPPNEKDVAKIEKTILQERNKWTQGLPIQRRFKDLYPDVESVMIRDLGYDPATGGYTKTGARAAEQARAKQLKLQAAAKVVVTICQSKGILYKSSMQEIVDHEKDKWYTLADLEAEVSYLFKQGIKYIDDTQSVIDFRKYKDIEKVLITAQVSSVYELLGLTPQDPFTSFGPAIKDANLKNKSIATTPKGTARGKILGYADSIFKTADSKKKYDEYLAVKEEVWDGMALLQSHGIKEIGLEEYLNYADTMKAKLGMGIDQVEVYLAAGLRYFKLVVAGSEKQNATDLEICPYPECGKAYRVEKGKSVKACPHCGKPLEIVCWSCGGKMPYTNKSKTCPTCHSSLQSKSVFEARVADIEKLLRQPGISLIELQSALSNLINTVPGYKSTPNGFASKKIAEYERVVADKVKEEETTGANYRNDQKKIQTLINAKNYLQAQNAAKNLQKTYGSYNAAATASLLASIEKVLSQAQSLLESAKAYAAKNDESMVVSCAAKIMDLCADYSEARQLLQKYPPKAPVTIRQSVTANNVVRIEWSKSESDSMTTYTLVKKVGSKPTGANDGTVLDKNLTINFYEDANIVSATPYYYGVFAERCGITSEVAATAVPAMVFLDIDGLRQDVVEGKISVHWEAPHNVKSIEIWKKEGPVAPTGVGDGVQLKADGMKGFVDDQCAYENSYLIICVYEANGIRKYSRGIRRTMKKYEPLRKLENPVVEQQVTGEFIFRCDAKGDRKIRMIYARERLSCAVDTVMQMLDYNTICKGATPIEHHCDEQQNILFSLPEGQMCWVYPMVYNEQLFMLSKPFLLNNINGLSNITYTEEQGTVRIKGILNGDAKNIIAVVGADKFPESVDSPGEKFVVRKDRYIADGGVVIKLKSNSVNYISLFVELEKDGAKTMTRPVRVGDGPIDYREKVVIYHSVDYKIPAGKRFSVTVTFSAEEPIELPRLCLVKGYPRPMTKNMGQLVETIEPMQLKKGLFSKTYTAKVKVTAGPCPLNTKFVVFLYDEADKYVQLKAVNKI